MIKFFDEKESRRILYVLRTRKGNSICGNRDGNVIRRVKERLGTASQNVLHVASRRSLSIYSERGHLNGGVNNNDDDPNKPFEWRYRVQNRDHIPDFFPRIADNTEVMKDPSLRYSTPEKLTYHLPVE